MTQAIVDARIHKESPYKDKAVELIRRATRGKHTRKWKLTKARSVTTGAFTYVSVELTSPSGKKKYGAGQSKRSPHDLWNPEVGITIALSRAVHDALDSNHGS